MKNRISTRILLAVVIGCIIGALWLVAVRYVTFKSNTVHYHANFGLFINGQRDEFKNFTFYEEVQACGSNDHNDAKVRVHMHDMKNHVVHVHDNNVTWGAFFANLGYTLGNTVVQTDQGTFIDGQDGKKLQFVLNGKPVQTAANRVIQSEDILLITYGDQSAAEVQKQYDAIPKDAHAYNEKNDPSTCSGGEKITPAIRLRRAIGIGTN